MEEQNNLEEVVKEDVENEEIGLADKIVNVYTEPTSLFKKLSFLPPNTMDWFLPVLAMILIAVLSNFVLMSNPEIKSDIVDKQMQQFEKNFQEAVDKGQMTQSQADEQLDNIAERMEEGGSGQIIISSVGIIIISFLSFFIITGVYLLLVKFGLKGEGDYKTAMVSYGLPHYIIVIQIIAMMLSAIALGKMFMDTSIGSFMGIEKDGLYGWFMHKLDPFSIWFYAVVSIAFAKMFKSEDTTKYYIAIFGLWIGFSLLMHFVAQAFPFLKWFGM